MFDRFDDRTKNVIIFVMLSLVIILGLSYGRFHNAAAIFFPSAGIYVGFYYIYRKRVLPGILLAILLTNLVYRIVFSDELLLVSIALSILFLLSNFVELYLFSYLVDRFKIKITTALNTIEMIYYSMAVLLVAAVGALIGATSLLLFYGATDFGLTFLYWMIGSFTGIVIFGSLILNSHYHDQPLQWNMRRVLLSIGYIVLFGSLVLFMFMDIGHNYISFEGFQIFVVLLYIIAAFSFSFRMIAVSNLLFIIGINLVYFPMYGGSDFAIEEIRLNLYVMFLSIIGSVVRIILLERQTNYNNMKTARDNIERLILSTNNLLQFENKLPEEAQAFNVKYLIDMFEIACELYPNFDRASCHVKRDKYVDFVAAKGYDITHLNDLKFLSEGFIWTHTEPLRIRDTDYDIVFEKQYSTKQQEFISTYGNLRESIRFTVMFSEVEVAGMSFDLYEGTDTTFTSQDMDNFRSFQTLMNSYYRIGILNAETHQLKDDIVLSLVRTLELYDRYTGSHSEEVAELSVLIAREMNLSEENIRNIYWSGIVHDIGKIGLPDSVLNKAGSLTDEEYQIVKQHPIYGYDILAKSPSLVDIAAVVKHHHEWWNGKGYPDQLRATDIPLAAQILHVCDAVDAMAKDRVYRKKRSLIDIIHELQTGKGQQFSPLVADVMIQFIESGRLNLFFKRNKQVYRNTIHSTK